MGKKRERGEDDDELVRKVTALERSNQVISSRKNRGARVICRRHHHHISECIVIPTTVTTRVRINEC